jgi:predicted amidohydrolase
VSDVCVGAIQPPVPAHCGDRAAFLAQGTALIGAAARAGAGFVCLPEYYGVFGYEAVEAGGARAGDAATLADLRRTAASLGIVILYPTVESADGRLYNTTFVLGPDGAVRGSYRKAHLTEDESVTKKLTPGDDLPVFSEAGLTFGVMTCYDGHFPETARVLALRGATVVFFPSLQRGATGEFVSLQLRSRALDNCLAVVRSSYGYPADVPWKPGMMVGMTSVTDCEGRTVMDIGNDVGYVTWRVPREPRPRLKSFQGVPGAPRDFIFEHRRPDLYGPVCDAGPRAR